MNQWKNWHYILLPVIQILFFIGVYDILNTWAHEHRYIYSNGVGWGISVQIYTIEYITIVLLTSALTYFIPRKRLLITILSSIAFSALVMPVLDSYPYRGGAVIVIGVLGLFLNYFYLKWKK